MAKIELSQKKILKALQSKKVRQSLRSAADQIASKGSSIAAAEDIDGDFTVGEGTRPQGRPYSRVTFSNVDQEHGTSKTRRSRVLGRAGEEVLPGEVS